MALGPKNSFTMSVITNSSGHNNTPQVSVKERPGWPKSEKENGLKPNVLSREKILPPIHSAISALAIKKAVKNTNSLVGLSSRSFRIILVVRLVGRPETLRLYK